MNENTQSNFCSPLQNGSRVIRGEYGHLSEADYDYLGRTNEKEAYYPENRLQMVN